MKLTEKISSLITAINNVTGNNDTDLTTAIRTLATDGTIDPIADVSGNEIGTEVSDYSINVVPGALVETAGYVSSISDGATVTRYIQVESKSATPAATVQTITPSSGKLLKSVSVGAVSLTGNAQASDVLAGKTFYNYSLNKLTGTAVVPVVSQDSSSKILSIS